MGGFFVLIDGFRDILLEDSQGLFSDFFFTKIVGDNVFDKFLNFRVSFGEVLVKLVSNHLFELFPLLNGLGLFDGGVDLAAFLGALGFGLIVVFGHGCLF